MYIQCKVQGRFYHGSCSLSSFRISVKIIIGTVYVCRYVLPPPFVRAQPLLLLSKPPPKGWVSHHLGFHYFFFRLSGVVLYPSNNVVIYIFYASSAKSLLGIAQIIPQHVASLLRNVPRCKLHNYASRKGSVRRLLCSLCQPKRIRPASFIGRNFREGTGLVGCIENATW